MNSLFQLIRLFSNLRITNLTIKNNNFHELLIHVHFDTLGRHLIGLAPQRHHVRKWSVVRAAMTCQARKFN